MPKLSRSLATLAVVALCAAAASCNGLDRDRSDAEQPLGTQAPVRPKPGGRLVVGLENDPNGLDPTQNAWDNGGIQLANALYDPLVAIDADGKPQPYLAQSLTPSPDFKLWTIKLRPGVTFHDGKPFNAAAAATFVQAIRDSIITGPPAQNIANVRAVDDLTMEIAMARPWAAFPALLSGQGGYVVSPDQLKDKAKGHSEPNGTGPFVLRSWKTDDHFELVRNPRYWRAGLPLLDAVEFSVVNDGRDRLERLKTGAMDVATVNRLSDVKALEDEQAKPNAAYRAIADTSEAEKDTVTFNTSKAPFNDLRVRQAIAYATDVNALSVAQGWPTDRAAPGLLSASSPYFSAQPLPRPDLERARSLVREYLSDPKVKDKPRDIAFTLNAADFDVAWVQTLVAQWARAGIVAKLNLVPTKQLVRLAVVGLFEATMLRYFSAADPDVLWHFFVQDTIKSDTTLSLNFARFANADLTKAFEDGRASADPEVRKRAYAKAQAVLAQQLPYLWLNRMEWRIATTSKVRDPRNVTLPDGSPAEPYLAGTFRLTETWIDG
jgi:peptide/nickel transport system substrate-binding protein